MVLIAAHRMNASKTAGSRSYYPEALVIPS
jgi:hypothetical protein